jgi:hypothetical protein
MKKFSVLLICLLATILNGQNPPPLFNGYEYRIEKIETDEGEFTAWIVEDDHLKGLQSKLKTLSKVEVDKEDKHLVFITYSDETYEYVLARNKRRLFTVKFKRVTAYKI